MFVQSREESGVSYALLRVVWTLFEFDKKSHYYETDTPLFEAEIHMIVAIQDCPGLHLAGYAQKFGVTKGAISQIVQKLERKGMVTKEKVFGNQSKIMLALTEKGRVAYAAHARLHREFDAMIDRLLEGEPAEHVMFLKNFLRKVEKEADSFEW